VPLYARPTGVRTEETTTTSRMGQFYSAEGACGDRVKRSYVPSKRRNFRNCDNKENKDSPEESTRLTYSEVKVRLDYRWRNCHALSSVNLTRGSPSKSRIADLG
jgi:hypothetical protein